MIGYKDLDFKILYMCDDIDMKSIFQLTKYSRHLSFNEDFWRNRILNKYSNVLGSVDEINIFRGKKTWREYYVDLVCHIQEFDELIFSPTRKDLKLLSSQYCINAYNLGSEVNNNFEAGKWKEILKEELINPNVLFFTHLVTNENNRKIIWQYLVNSDDKRIDPSYNNSTILDNLDLDEDVELIDKILSYENVRPDILFKTIVTNIKYEKYLYDCRITLTDLTNTILDIKSEKIRVDGKLFVKYLDLLVSKGCSFERLDNLLKCISDDGTNFDLDATKILFAYTSLNKENEIAQKLHPHFKIYLKDILDKY